MNTMIMRLGECEKMAASPGRIYCVQGMRELATAMWRMWIRVKAMWGCLFGDRGWLAGEV